MAALRVLTWNLLHGRDHPPAGSDRHAEVNRVLQDEFAALIAAERWDVAFLQEAPPHWLRPLCRVAGADGASVLTSRNAAAPVRRLVARRSPDLIKSGEGGSNQLLVRDGWRLAKVRRLTLTLLPERRRLIWARLEHPCHATVTVANLHASAHDRGAAARDVKDAARASCSWSAELPLVFGGDLNLRPSQSAAAFDLLRDELGLRGATEPHAIDHLLARGLRAATGARSLPPEWRDVTQPDGRAVRLSDHAPVVADYDVGSSARANGGG